MNRGFAWLLMLAFYLLSPGALLSAAEEQEQEVQKLDDILINTQGEKREMRSTPEGTVIDASEFETIGEATSVLDLLKTQAAVDFNGLTDLTPNEDTITLRGFASERFVTAIDGLTAQKTGGRKGTHIVDYALMPAFLIDTVELLPGPHSALYDAKAIGGVVNMITKRPTSKADLKPDLALTTSYSSYNTQNHTMSLEGGLNRFTYDVGYQKNTTDGYLRESEADIETVFSRIGYILPNEGFVTMCGSYSTADRETPVNNNPAVDDYDSDYPDTEGSLHDPWQKPTWDKDAWAYRLNYAQNLTTGKLTAGAYMSKENRDRAYWDWVNAKDHSRGTRYTSGLTVWRQVGGKIMNEYQWTENQTTTLGFDMVSLRDGSEEKTDPRVSKKGTFVQHQLEIVPSVDLKLGLRYEDLKIRVSNSPTTQIKDRGEWIERYWDELLPKSFITWKMETLSEALRDTSLSAGVSRIWHAPDCHGDYNPQGRPVGAWLEPEHGVGYDLIFMRRLFGEIQFKMDYSYYEIKDYIASNSNYAEHAKAGTMAQGAFSDYAINLEEIHRHGLETELDGKITEDLSFYLTHAWQEYANKGDEPAGKTNLADAPDHRVSAGLRYTLFERTALLLDWEYRSKETMEVSEEYDDPVTKETLYTWDQVDNPAYSLIDIGLKQKIFQNKGLLKEATLSCYIQNLFDEKYYTSRGYPATDRTYGASLNFKL